MWGLNRKNRCAARFCSVVLGISLLCTGCVSDEEYALLQAELDQANADCAELRGELDELQSTYDLLKTEAEMSREEYELIVEQLQENIRILTDTTVASDAQQQVLLDQIRALRENAEADAEQIRSLTDLITNYENITSINFGYQAQSISNLLMKLAQTNRPTRTIETETVTEEGETIVVTEEVPGMLAFSYLDLTTGYNLSYNQDEVMYSASLIKAPYIYSLLKSVADFEYRKLNYDADGNPLYDEEGNPLFEGNHPNLSEDGSILYAEDEQKYNLNRIWVFDKETMMENGSGSLKDAESGIELTYLELVRYALQYSDNIAFAQLRKMFGYTEYYGTVRDLGVKGTSYGFMQLSASDCVKFLKAIYEFIDTNEIYGTVMKEALVNSNYSVMIPYAVSSTPCAHKYGWDIDAYHDMAIVYDEHPYILVIMTDLDQGGTTVNAYIQEVVRMTNRIHRNFYG